MPEIAFVTQSYRADLDECRLLCESIDRFAPDVAHYIFVNDEDVELFAPLASQQRHIFPKSVLLPRWLFNCPLRVLGHRYHLSPFTIPVREWIIQQICKLAVFEFLPASIEAVYNFDSEVVLMKPFTADAVMHDSRYPLFRVVRPDEPSQDDYIRAARRLLKLSADEVTHVADKCYMSVPVCFVRENVEALTRDIASRSPFGSWKWSLCNTYRFSEYYTYGIFTTLRLDSKNHYLIDRHDFPVVDISLVSSAEQLLSIITPLLAEPTVMGLWLQKRDRRTLAGSYLPFEDIEKVVKSLW